MPKLPKKYRNKIICGDCLKIMSDFPDNSIDSVVTDAPYHLTSVVKRFGKKGSAAAKTAVYAWASKGFMGCKWDGGNLAFRPETWTEMLRVLKPGGYLLAFGGSRTYHRMACAIEDAGFEIRDQIAWLYSSGFPKSHDVSLAIDRAAGAKRKVVGTKRLGGNACMSTKEKGGTYGVGVGVAPAEDVPITEPATDEAKHWEGWGDALKPAHEPLVLARKPFKGSTAKNVLKYGTGALNIDGCRVGTESRHNQPVGAHVNTFAPYEGKKGPGTDVTGRWPANVIHDGSDEVFEEFAKAGDRPAGKSNNFAPKGVGGNITPFRRGALISRNDSGSAARFFYCCPQQELCFLCGLTMDEKHDIMREKKGGISCSKSVKNVVKSSKSKKVRRNKGFVVTDAVVSTERGQEDKVPSKNTHAHNAAKISHRIPVITESIVPGNVLKKAELKLVQNVKSAGNLCDQCATAIAQSIVAMQQDQNPDSLAGLVFISEHNKQILIQNLVLLVESLENTDTIPTISVLKLLFGSVQNAIDTSIAESISGSGPSKFHYQSKASRYEKEAGLENMPAKKIGMSSGAQSYGEGYDKGQDIGLNRVIARKNTHPTVKPISLCRYLCRLVTPPKGIVLDPFAGSGSTCIAAVLEGFRFVGIELDKHYCRIAKLRIKNAQDKTKPFF